MKIKNAGKNKSKIALIEKALLKVCWYRLFYYCLLLRLFRHSRVPFKYMVFMHRELYRLLDKCLRVNLENFSGATNNRKETISLVVFKLDLPL